MKLVPALIAGAVAHAAVANAQPASAQAEILFRQGKELLAKGQISDACAAFDASQKLDPSTSTVINQANCREKNQQLATAWGLYLDAERATRTAADASGQQLHDLASSGVTRLEPRLSTLTIVVSEDAKVLGLEVLRDKDVVDVGAWNKSLPSDGGTYRVTARAPGNAEWSSTITVGAERDSKTVAIPKLKGAEPDKPARAEPVRADPPRSEPGRSEPPARTKPVMTAAAVAEPTGAESSDDDGAEQGSRRRWIPYAVGGGGLAFLGGALALELVAESTYDRSVANWDVNEQITLWHHANIERYAAGGLLVGGLAAVGVATWLYIRDRRAERAFVVAPVATPDGAGVQLVGGF